MSRFSLAGLLTVGLVLAAAVHAYLVAFHRTFFFRDIDIHREIGRRFLSGEYLYANDYCYAYLPTAGLYFAPLTLMGRNESLVLRYMVAVGCLAVTAFLFYRMMYGTDESKGKSHPLARVGAVVLTLQFIIADLDDGGPHLILLAILTCGIYAIWVGREWVGAVLFGLGIALKITPALFVCCFFGSGSGEWLSIRCLPPSFGSFCPPFTWGRQVGGSIRLSGQGMPPYPCSISRHRAGNQTNNKRPIYRFGIHLCATSSPIRRVICCGK